MIRGRMMGNLDAFYAVKDFLAVGREPSGVLAKMKNRRARALPVKPKETQGKDAS
ncbi:hypothetical protein Enr13x_12960 [Stieleria neptunia]|uniref:Uncharacterized protein n=1 Tax=Stieleria neptunia TaxID=2527979 RepID=A0A518HKT7_9BACT|nr:hypothetical protein Enr13x_12960 [Stieleria neptunia]